MRNGNVVNISINLAFRNRFEIVQYQEGKNTTHIDQKPHENNVEYQWNIPAGIGEAEKWIGETWK